MNLLTLLGILFLTCIKASRILVCVPTPSVSHQVLFYPLITELLNRGHEVVFVTTDSMYPKGHAPANLTEIDTHEVSYAPWRERVLGSTTTTGKKTDSYRQMSEIIPVITKSFEIQMMTPEVQDLIEKKTHFDLLIVEGISKPAQALSHVFKAPMILMNSFGGFDINFIEIGAPIFPKLLYPNFWHQKLNKMSILDKIKVFWDKYYIDKFFDNLRVQENILVKKLFGQDTPTLEKLGNNLDMLFLNVYPFFDCNRPVPPGVVYIGGIHQKPRKELPEELKTYLDTSTRGVVYFSMGTNVCPSTLSAEKIEGITKGLARLKYDVLVKWDHNVLPGKGNNTIVAKWLPQSDLLRHPKIKAFITQGGLQSFDEAMTGGVPLVGIPLLGDQWYNVEKYALHKIGIALLMEELTEDILENAVNTVIDDPSYRRNFIALREKVRDQPQSALERAVWWSEHVIRHKGAAHLRAPAANMSWTEYLDLGLWTTIALLSLFALSTAVTALYRFLRLVNRVLGHSLKLKVA